MVFVKCAKQYFIYSKLYSFYKNQDSLKLDCLFDTENFGSGLQSFH